MPRGMHHVKFKLVLGDNVAVVDGERPVKGAHTLHAEIPREHTLVVGELGQV